MFWLDTTFLAILTLGAVLGAMSGLLWQVGRIASLAAAVYGAILLNAEVFPLLQENVLQGVDPRITSMTAYVTVFIAIYVICFMVTRLIYQGMEAVRLEPIDRLLGASLGLAKAVLLVGVVSWGLAAVSHPTTQEVIDQSELAPIFVQGMDTMLQIVPAEVKTDLCEGLQSLKDLARAKTN